MRRVLGVGGLETQAEEEAEMADDQAKVNEKGQTGTGAWRECHPGGEGRVSKAAERSRRMRNRPCDLAVNRSVCTLESALRRNGERVGSEGISRDESGWEDVPGAQSRCVLLGSILAVDERRAS